VVSFQSTFGVPYKHWTFISFYVNAQTKQGTLVLIGVLKKM